MWQFSKQLPIKMKQKIKPTTKNICNRKIWFTGAVQIHVDPPPVLWIKSKNDTKAEKDSVKNKLCRVPTLEKLDMYELKIALLENGEPEEFLLSI